MSQLRLAQNLHKTGQIIVYSFILMLLIRPLWLPNWWIRNGNVLEIDSTWQSTNCGFRFDRQFVELSETFTNSSGGGKYENRDCRTTQEVAIIVPYRNRSEHLRVFLDQIHHFLLTQNSVNYRIFVVEQLDDGPFNRGLLLNVGFLKALADDPKLDCFIFHDVDVIPMDFRQYYTCSIYPKHLCSYLDKSRYVLMYREFFGVVVAINRQQYQQINGFSNIFFGWGGEDDDFYERIKHKFTSFQRYDPQVSRCRMFRHPHNKAEAADRFDLLTNTLERMDFDGLNSVEKFYTNYSMEYLQYFTRISVRLHQ